MLLKPKETTFLIQNNDAKEKSIIERKRTSAFSLSMLLAVTISSTFPTQLIIPIYYRYFCIISLMLLLLILNPKI